MLNEWLDQQITLSPKVNIMARFLAKFQRTEDKTSIWSSTVGPRYRPQLYKCFLPPFCVRKQKQKLPVQMFPLANSESWNACSCSRNAAYINSKNEDVNKESGNKKIYVKSVAVNNP